MTLLVTLDEAKAQWDALIARVEAGEESLIAINGATVVRLTRFGSEPATENIESAMELFEPKP